MKKYLVAGVFMSISVAVIWAATGTIQTWTGKGDRRNTVEMTIESPSVGSAANLKPGAASANDLGTSAAYWEDAWVESVGFGAAVSTASAPQAAGMLIINASNELFISTGTSAGQWQKVGAQ